MDLLGETRVKEAKLLVRASTFSLRCGCGGQVALKWMKIRQVFRCTVPFDKMNGNQTTTGSSVGMDEIVLCCLVICSTYHMRKYLMN